MARVTVEDCILNIPNRFELVTLAAQRAKQISSGNPITVDRDNDKDGVVSLREIADKTIDFAGLSEEIIEKYSRYQRPDTIEGEAPMVIPANQRPHRPIAQDVKEAYEEDAEEIEDEVMMDDEVDGLSFDEENVDTND
jgi:DNA-directed RNA polymerase subunit omega